LPSGKKEEREPELIGINRNLSQQGITVLDFKSPVFEKGFFLLIFTAFYPTILAEFNNKKD
jgi:hypothetical protein